VTLDDFTESDEMSPEENQRLFGLGQVPSDWGIKPLLDVAEIIPGNSPPSSTYNDKGDGLPFFQGNSNFGHFHPEVDTWCSEPRKESQPKDVLISIRAPVGDLNIADRNSCIGRGIAAIRPTNLNGLYLYYNLGERKVWLSRLATGSTFKAINKSDLQLLDVPTPPLSEQRKIATVLYTVDQAIQKTEEIVNHTKRLREALLDELLVSGYGDNRATQEGYIGPRKVEYPRDWLSVELGDLTEKITKGKTPTSYGYDYIGSGVNFVKVESISDHGSIDTSEFDYIGEDAHEHLSGSALEEGDILFSIAGALGKVTQINEELLPANTNQALALIRVNDSRAIPEYIRYYLETTLIQKYIQSIATTTAQSNLNLKQVSEFKILLPEVNEQKKILKVIHTIEEKLRCEESQKEQYQRLKQGLMQDLLSGTVRTTDTNIEVPDEIAQHG
jgi:type I restriction enzyme S subunit